MSTNAAIAGLIKRCQSAHKEAVAALPNPDPAADERWLPLSVALVPIHIELPRQRTTTCSPAAILLTPMTIGAPAVITAAEGFIESSSAQAAAAAPPMTAVAPVTSVRKSRRVSPFHSGRIVLDMPTSVP